MNEVALSSVRGVSVANETNNDCLSELILSSTQMRQVWVAVTASQCLPRTGEEEDGGVLGDELTFSTCTAAELFLSKQPAGSQPLKM